MTRQEPIFERRIEPRWVLADRPSSEAIEAIRSELNIPNVMAKILINRGVDNVDDAREFLYPSLDHLIDPFLMIDMDKAVDRIWTAIDGGEKIMIHGDYDVDGVTGTSVLVRSIGHLGAEVTFYIPNRLEEGYGISKEAIDACGERGVTLLVSVDCGITAVQETEYARSCGVDVIITDHHQTGEIPKAVAVVDPKRPDCPYPFKELPGVALAFSSQMLFIDIEVSIQVPSTTISILWRWGVRRTLCLLLTRTASLLLTDCRRFSIHRTPDSGLCCGS